MEFVNSIAKIVHMEVGRAEQGWAEAWAGLGVSLRSCMCAWRWAGRGIDATGDCADKGEEGGGMA